jgi:integrase
MKKPKPLVQCRYRADRGKWETDHRNPLGVTPARERRLFDTESEAAEYKLKVTEWLEAGGPVDDVDPAMTLGDAFGRYFLLKARKRSLPEDRRHAGHLTRAFGPDIRLRDLTAGRIGAYRARRLAATSLRRKDAAGHATPLSAASINRPLALLRHLLRLARDEWGVLEQVPVVKLEREPEGRIRWLEPDEEARLLAACADSDNPNLRPIVTLALESGMRQGEIMGMTWERVDMSRGVIRLERTKSGRRREVPMRQVVYNLLAARPEPREGRVWPELNNQTGWDRTGWEKAVEAARIDDLHFHDTRHHFASWFVMRGGALPALQQILGHATLAMTMRYAHLSPGHLRAEISKTERVATFGAASNSSAFGTSSGTREGSDDEGAAQVVDFTADRRGSSEAEQLIRNQ